MQMFGQVKTMDEFNESGNIRECYKCCMSRKNGKRCNVKKSFTIKWTVYGVT